MGRYKAFLTEEELLAERYVNEVNYLKKYITMSDEDKKLDLMYKFDYLLPQFLERELEYSDDEIAKLYSPSDPDIDTFIKEHSDLAKEFGDWLYKNIWHSDSINPAELLSWVHFEYKRDITNQWLVHFSDHAYDIAKDGKFKYGIPDLDQLGLTTWYSKRAKERGGYNFSYTLEDAIRYGKESRTEYKYGKEGVIFRASGIEVRHFGDQEDQVIFLGSTANTIIHFKVDSETDKWTIYSARSGNKIVAFDELKDLLAWVETNYAQYRKQLEY